MLESDWLTNVLRCAIIFRETHGERSSRQFLTALQFRITSPNDFGYFKRSYNNKTTKTHNDTGQTHKYSKQWDKNDRSVPCFATKLHFIMYVKHILYFSRSLSLTPLQTDTHTHTHTHTHTVSLHTWKHTR
jgi:hypothetical protein